MGLGVGKYRQCRADQNLITVLEQLIGAGCVVYQSAVLASQVLHDVARASRREPRMPSRGTGVVDQNLTCRVAPGNLWTSAERVTHRTPVRQRNDKLSHVGPFPADAGTFSVGSRSMVPAAGRWG